MNAGRNKTWVVSFCLAFLTVFPGVIGFSHAQTDLSKKNVLILHAFHSNAPVYLGTGKGLSAALQSRGISVTNQFYEFLDLSRHTGSEQRKMLVEQMRLRYGRHNVDMIITMFPEALDFVLKDCRDILPAVPILALYLPQGAGLPAADRPIIGHFPAVDVTGTLEIALRLAPGTKRVYVVSGVHVIDKRMEDQARRSAKGWEERLEFVYWSHMSVEAMLEKASGIPPGSIVLALTVIQDSAGKAYSAPMLVQQLSRVSPVPIFGVLDVTLGHGIVGGSLINYEHIGAKAAELTLDMLGGARPPVDVPSVLDVPPVPMFDWRELRRWNLSTDDLPEGSIVINRETTLWDFRYFIIGILAFCLAETALIVLLILQIRRKRMAEQALRESEERLDLATSAAGMGIWIMNTDTRSVWVTDKLRQLFRFAPDEALRFERFLEVIHPDDRERVSRSVVTSLERREPLSIEYRIVHPDGAIRWIASRGRAYAGAPGRPERLMGVSSDVTPRKLTEVQLRESQTLLSALVDSTSDLIWSVDAERFGLLTFNRGLFDYFLKERDLRIEAGMDPGVLLPTEEYAEKWRSFYRRALEHGSFTTEYPVYSGTRTLLLSLNRLERDGVVFGVSVFGKDITERKRSEEALRESEAKYRSLYESMMDGYVRVDMDGRILECNEAYRSMTGYDEDELRGLTYLDITPKRWHAAEREIIERQVLVRGYSDVYEKEYRKKDGTLIVIELRTFLLKDATGSHIGMWAIVRDITDRKQTEMETRKLREELVHLSRVSTLGEFTSTLAHEINQPLAAILSNAQAAQRILSLDNPDIREIGEILEDIIRDDNRAAGVIRKIRTLMKKEEPRYETLDLNDVIEEILHTLRNETALAGVSIVKGFDLSLPAVWGDRVQLQQVILNLVMNAAEAMRDTAADDHRLTVTTSDKDGRFAEVSIRDTGPGIDEHPAGRLFDPFYTTKAGGLGMGLVISKEIVKSHRGEIRAVSNPDRGATFSFTVPFARGVTK